MALKTLYLSPTELYLVYFALVFYKISTIKGNKAILPKIYIHRRANKRSNLHHHLNLQRIATKRRQWVKLRASVKTRKTLKQIFTDDKVLDYFAMFLRLYSRKNEGVWLTYTYHHSKEFFHYSAVASHGLLSGIISVYLFIFAQPPSTMI